MKPGEIRGMADVALLSELEDNQKKLLEMRCSVALGDEVNPAQLKIIRKDIARMKTILNERKVAEAAGGSK